VELYQEVREKHLQRALYALHDYLFGRAVCRGYVIANDEAQATDRIFTAAARIVEASPLLQADITATKIAFSNGSFIQALASDYRGAAGSAPTIVLADEIWGFTFEGAARLWDECCPTPTRKPSVRMVTSYAGITGESALLERLVKRGLSGEMIAKDLYTQSGMIAFISHDRIAPWQAEAWLEEARASTRPSAFMRQYQNEFTSGESTFVDMDDYDRCVDADARPVLSDPHLQVWLGLDGSYAHDSTAIAAVTFDTTAQRVRLVAHRIFIPSKDEPLDFGVVEEALLEMRRRFALKQVFFDPFQLVALSQRMTTLGLPMEPFTQSSSNLEAASNNLAELIRHHNLSLYSDPEIRLAMSRTVAVETPRGLRISKSKASHRVDIIAALSFACLAAVREGHFRYEIAYRPAPAPPRGRWDERPSDASRLYGRGEDLAREEDASAARLGRTWSSRWRNSGF
jgi:phage terminase large subunit-like protein